MGTATEAPPTAVARIRNFVAKGTGTPLTNERIQYNYDPETGQAHLTLYGRAFAFASPERIEADAKEGVHRAALCRDILHTILATVSPDRVEKFDLKRLANEWQSMATLPPLPSKVLQQLSPPTSSTGSRMSVQQAGHQPMPATTQQAGLQQSTLDRPVNSATQQDAGRMLGSHSLVSPSTSTHKISSLPSFKPSSSSSGTQYPSNGSTSAPSAPAALRNLPPATASPMYPSPSRPPEPSTSSLPKQASTSGLLLSKPAQFIAPVASTSLNLPSQAQATSARPPPSPDQHRPTSTNSPDFHNKDEARAYRSVLNAPVPRTAVERIRWMCEVHLSHCKAPSVYKPYLDFQMEGNVVRLSVARNTLGVYELPLHGDELYLMQYFHGREWLKEELARRAIDKGIFTRTLKVKMPKANIKPDLVGIIRRFSNTKDLAENSKPSPPLQNKLDNDPTFNTVAYGRPPLQIASSSTAIPAPQQIAATPLLATTRAAASPPTPQRPQPPINGFSSMQSTVQGSLPLGENSPASLANTASLTHEKISPILLVQGESKQGSTMATGQSSPTLPSAPNFGVKAVTLSNHDRQGSESGQQAALAKDASSSGSGATSLPIPSQTPVSRDPRLQARLAMSARHSPNDTPVDASASRAAVPAPPTDALLEISPRRSGERASPSFGHSEEVATALPVAADLKSSSPPVPQAERSEAPMTTELDPSTSEGGHTAILESAEIGDDTLRVRAPSLSERLALSPPPPPLIREREEQSLLARLQSSESVMHSKSKEASSANEQIPSEATGEQVGGTSLLDRLANMKAELRKRIGVQRSASKQSTQSSEEAVQQDSGMQVDEPAVVPGPVVAPVIQKGDPPTDKVALIASQEADKAGQTAKHASPQSSEPPQGETHLQRIAGALAPSSGVVSEPARAADPIAAKTLAAVGISSPAKQAIARAQETAGASPAGSGQGSTSVVPVPPSTNFEPSSVQSCAGNENHPTPKANPIIEPSQRESDATRTVLDDANAPVKATSAVVHLPRTVHAPEGRPNATGAPTATSDTKTSQAPVSATLSRSGSVRSLHSRPDTEVSNDDGRSKRRWEDSSDRTSSTHNGQEDGFSKRRRRSSPPPPLASVPRKDHLSRNGSGVDTASMTPSMLYSNVQSMTSILTKLAGGAITYDQACEAMYALNLPASMDTAAFEALEAIWAGSSAQMLQKASTEFGSSELVLMPKSWVEESMDLLQKEGSKP